MNVAFWLPFRAIWPASWLFEDAAAADKKHLMPGAFPL